MILVIDLMSLKAYASCYTPLSYITYIDSLDGTIHNVE